MTKQSKLAAAMVVIVGLVAVLMSSTAYAKPDQGGQQQRKGRGGDRPVFGEVISIDEDSITIAPVIPDFIAKIAEERGMELPTDLPDKVTIGLSSDTKWIVDSEKADASGFGIGDLVVISLKSGEYGQPTAMRIADEATAKQFIQSAKQHVQGEGNGGGQGGRGSNGQGGQGNRGGQGNDRQRKPPAFGEIIAMDADSITIQPEIPAFVQAKMDERGVKKEIELPAELTFKLGDKIRYIVDGEPSESNPFGIGDKVAVMCGGGGGGGGNSGGQGKACAIADYASAEAKMKEMGGKGKRGGKDQGGQGNKRGKGGKGKQGGQGGKRN